MYTDRIKNFGKAFEGRLESFLIEGALDYIKKIFLNAGIVSSVLGSLPNKELI
ncbi:hypothetical protein ACOZ12_003897 [Cronobacter turicensis]